jgi:type II secretory pathway pseudopilin PulG
MTRVCKRFLLVEVLVALGILGMGLAFLGRIGVQGARITRNNHRLTQGVLLAQEKMEEVFLLAEAMPLSVGVQAGEFDDSASGLLWRRSVSAYDAARPGLFSVTVAVSRSQAGASPLVRLYSVIHQDPNRFALR